MEKIQIDPDTRMYRGVMDGRVHVFHGLDTEDSSRPWYLRTLDQQQIDLMKTVRDLNISRLLDDRVSKSSVSSIYLLDSHLVEKYNFVFGS